MDHVPYPQDPAWPLIEIPYLCADLEEYDGLDFINYPVRQGWAQEAHSDQWMDCPWETAAKRAQNWLYFGLLLEVIGPFYKKELFLRKISNNDGYLIHTSKLPKILQDWSRSVRGTRFQIFRSSKVQEVSQRCREIFWETNMQSDRLDRNSSDCRTVTLGIKVLLQSLQNAVSGLAPKDEASISQMNSVSRARLLYLRMVRTGWCESQTYWLTHNYTVIMANYLAALPRRFVGLDHKDCNSRACTANDVNEMTYQTAHTTEGCQCEFKGPGEARILQPIKEGNIPLISVTLMPDDVPRIEIVKAEAGVKYTAISHVWSGGLGNPRENKLPACQFLKIYRLLAEIERQKLPRTKLAFELLWQRSSILRKKFRLQSLAGPQRGYLPISMEFSEYRGNTPLVFWIDTLCVPVGKKNKPFRVQAIRSMDLIYAGAENTLVLDSELQQIPQTFQEQMSAHVLCSSWMARCWTLQEARVSQRCFIQFADGLFDPQNAERLINQDGNNADRKHSWNDVMYLKMEAILWYYAMIPMRDPLYEVPFKVRGQFLNEWNNLEQRSTSRKEDIHCIFASMLGLNGGDILIFPHEQRMKAILRDQTSLPLSLLFLSCPKMEERSCRWIPTHPGLGTSLSDDYGEMKVSKDGLMFGKSTANYMGFLVASAKPRLDRFCLQENLDSEALWVTVKSDGTNSVFRSSTSIASCYILGKSRKQDRVKPPWFEKGTEVREGGALFAVQRREGRVLFLLYECPLEYENSRPSFYDSEGRYMVDQSDFPLLDAEVLPADQIFQIDCDVDSWPEIRNRRHLLRDAREESGFEFYSYTAATVTLCIWTVFGFFSGLEIGKSGHISTNIGLNIIVVLIRVGFLWAERGMLHDSLDRHTRGMYIQSFARLEEGPDNASKTWSSVQFEVWHVVVAMFAALVLLLLGAIVSSQRWALWMGLAIPVEISIRLVFEFLWRKTRFGNVIKNYLKKKGWW